MPRNQVLDPGLDVPAIMHGVVDGVLAMIKQQGSTPPQRITGSLKAAVEHGGTGYSSNVIARI